MGDVQAPEQLPLAVAPVERPVVAWVMKALEGLAGVLVARCLVFALLLASVHLAIVAYQNALVCQDVLYGVIAEMAYCWLGPSMIARPLAWRLARGRYGMYRYRLPSGRLIERPAEI